MARILVTGSAQGLGRAAATPRSWDVCVGRPTSTGHLCRLTAVQCSIRWT
jgi:NAD(P)-dependent dehydrogenase (short-subunit alcohol dehydrogenase family)